MPHDIASRAAVAAASLRAPVSAPLIGLHRAMMMTGTRGVGQFLASLPAGWRIASGMPEFHARYRFSATQFGRAWP